MKEVPEFHQTGILSIENEDFVKGLLSVQHINRIDFGLQVAEDGRVWVCIDGIAFIRFSPHPNGRMGPDQPIKRYQPIPGGVADELRKGGD